MKTIIWDVDDVLNELMKEWFEKKWLTDNPESTLAYDDITQNPPHEVLNISLDEYRSSLDNFRTEFGASLKPVPQILTWFNEYGHKYKHMVVTAVPINLSPISAGWLFTHFGKWIHSFNIVPSPRPADPSFRYHQSKKEFLQWIAQGDFFVDDNPANILGVESLGINCLTAPQPWNKTNLTIDQLLLKFLS